MSKIQLKAMPKKFSNGSYLLLPATPVDKATLDNYCSSLSDKFFIVTVDCNKADKSYNQVKTVFALIDVRFSIQHHRKPTDTEQAYIYSSFLWKYADRIPNPINPDETVPVSLSKMSKEQAAKFIGSIIADIYEYAGNVLTDTEQVELKSIFEEFHATVGHGVGNPVDYDSDGNLLSEKEWRARNCYSFASGIKTQDLQLHHILSRGAHPEFENCAWNWIMLTDYEHNRIIHSRDGWQKFIELFPHTAQRIKTAYDTAHELYPHEIQVALIKLGLLDEYVGDIF